MNLGEAVALLGILALLVFMRKGLTWAGTAKEREHTRLTLQRLKARQELAEIRGKVALTEYAREMRLMPGDVVRELTYRADGVENREAVEEEAEEPAWKCDYCDTLNSSRVDRCSHCNAARGS